MAQQEHQSLDADSQRAMLNGTHPNPNLQVHRRGPNSNKRSRESMLAPGPAPQGRNGSVQFQQPSLTNHLVTASQQSFSAATQQPFLSHAGCGTLSVGPLAQWMVQDGHYTRGYIQFLGSMISKIRLPDVANSQFHPMYRTLDLLISALNNIRREMSFFEITATKYGIQLNSDPPSHITRAYIDMFNSVSSASSSLLEGMVVLWATEHVSFSICFDISAKTDHRNPVLPYRLDVRFLLHLHPHRPQPREPHRRSPPVTNTQLDLTRLFQVCRRMPSSRRRARKFQHNRQWQGRDDAMRAGLQADMLVTRALLAGCRRHGRGGR